MNPLKVQIIINSLTCMGVWLNLSQNINSNKKMDKFIDK